MLLLTKNSIAVNNSFSDICPSPYQMKICFIQSGIVFFSVAFKWLAVLSRNCFENLKEFIESRIPFSKFGYTSE